MATSAAPAPPTSLAATPTEPASPSIQDSHDQELRTTREVSDTDEEVKVSTPPQAGLNDRALHYKAEGNRYYGNKEYAKAATAYKLGLALDNSDTHDLEVALRSNLAMVLLKMEKFDAVEDECTIALALDSTQTKLWYRRALAREKMYQWAAASADLQKCLELLNDGGDVSVQKVATAALQRISQNLLLTAADLNQDYASQRNSVLTLLEARQRALQPAVTKEGEAFFLLDYGWWRLWCSKSNFFPKPNGSKGAFLQVLALLPPGAVCPHISDDDCGDELGPIDNSGLLLNHEDSFIRQWFAGEKIIPNLVRGHHYELIPREVYQAFVAWYGESTHPSCRRSNAEGIVTLYGTDCLEIEFFNTCKACRAPHAKSRCFRCLDAYYCGRACQESHWPYHKTQCGIPQEDRNGEVGFHNLGNTCFMNSALQCLSHATPLTRHFLSNGFLQDLNVHNPLGTGGKLARAYGQVMREVWMVGPSAVSPTTLKRAISIFAPRFAGCSQHDAQEFLAYLLDGLHEDLNRIREAPYVELPDVNENSAMAIAGADAWHAHQRRNDSLVMSTFYGQFKSTCVCPQCKCVSVSFDAFNHLSLEIPQTQSNRFIPILLFNNCGTPPARWMVEVRRGSFVADLRQALSDLCGIPSQRIALCDIYEYAMYEILQDNKKVDAIRTTDLLAAFDVDPYTNTTVHVICTHCSLTEEGERQPFGFPFLTSFSAEFTCRQVYDHLWERIKYVPGIQEEWVQLCVTDNNSKPRAVFPQESAFIPKDSDSKIVEFLGQGCTERFLFVSFEWRGIEYFDKTMFVQVVNHASYIEGLKRERTMGAGRTVTLDQCLQTFTRPERLDENNKWYCRRCQEHVCAMKTMELWRLPNVLVVHLKRFEFKNALRRDKLDTFVDFEMEGLDMSKYVSHAKKTDFVQDEIPAIYDLFAVTNHYGRLGFGHYTAFARYWDEKEDMSKDWSLFDDSSVRPVSPDSVLTPAAYVLFYRRRKFN
ncbi:ubiquitin-specific protease [Fragilaria crotonensis]|nr:ubiquitin-specific protease [Fragilaria crotonensis]